MESGYLAEKKATWQSWGRKPQAAPQLSRYRLEWQFVTAFKQGRKGHSGGLVGAAAWT